MARRVKGDRAFGRLLKQLPDSVANEIRTQMRQEGAMLVGRMEALAPVKSGAVKGALSWRLPPKQLRLTVGLVGKAINKKLFYAWLVEFGHRIAHGKALPDLQKVEYARTIAGRLARLKAKRAMRKISVPPHHFVFTTPRGALYAPFRGIWVRALRAARQGASDD